jgi:arylsulfatase A-like enzyme
MKRLLVVLAVILVPLLVLMNVMNFMSCGKSKERIIEKKQIILISIDTLRGDHLSSYGYFRDTSPHLSQLIKDSVYYSNAYPNGCWTPPSHMSLLTGTLPSRHGVNKDRGAIRDRKYSQLSDSIKSIPEILKSHHINTIKFAKLPPELGFSRGFDRDNRIDPFFDDETFGLLLKELENNKEKDFFLFIHTWMVHAPYSNTYFLKKGKIDQKKRRHIDKFRKIFIKRKIAGKLTGVFGAFLRRNKLFNVDDCMALYDGGIRYVDQYVGKIMEKTKQLNIYDNLLVIVTSDHGEHFSEHYPGRFYGFHGRDFYEEFIKVPLVIKYPYSDKTGRLDDLVSLIDVFPTVLDYYHMEIPAFVQGESLLKPHSQKDKKYIVSEAVSRPGIERKMIRIGDLKYIITMKNPTKAGRVNWEAITQRRLFDIKADPSEQDNLYNDLKFRQMCIDFEKILTRVIKHSTKTNRQLKETRISEETIKQMEALGYL